MSTIRQIIREAIIESLTKDVQLERVWDAERARNPDSLWVVHHLNAKLNGEKVGSLRISYIPREVFDREFASIFDFAYKVRGHSAFSNWRDDPKRTVESGFHAMGSFNYRTQDVEGDMKRLEQLLIDNYEDEFMEFEFFHVDKPTVDYIKVSPQYQRQGLATLLYHEGTKWMWEHKMHLHASGLQQPEAKAAWDKMKSQRHYKKFSRTMSADRSDRNMRIALDPKRLGVSK